MLVRPARFSSFPFLKDITEPNWILKEKPRKIIPRTKHLAVEDLSGNSERVKFKDPHMARSGETKISKRVQGNYWTREL